MWMSHKLHLIRKTSVVKVAKNFFAENLYDNPFLRPLSTPLLWKMNFNLDMTKQAVIFSRKTNKLSLPNNLTNNKKSVTTLRFRAGAPPWSQHPAKLSSHNSCEIGDIDFSNYFMTWGWSHDQRVMWLYWW